jgi:hypothetical protein
MTKLFLTIGLLLSGAALGSDLKEYRGILYNEICLTRRPDWLPYAGEHSRACAMLRECYLSGYYLVVDDSVALRLDRRGEMLARRALSESAREDGFHVVVRGRLDGETLRVSTLEEAK